MQKNIEPLRQFFRFATVGVAGTAVQYVFLWLGADLLGINAVVCSSAGYIAGSLANYILNRLFTFKSDRSHLEAATKYFIVLAFGWCLNTGTMWWLSSKISWNYWAAQLLATLICLAWNFSGNRLWAFRQKAVNT